MNPNKEDSYLKVNVTGFLHKHSHTYTGMIA